MLDQTREILVRLSQRPADDTRPNRRIFIGGDFPWAIVEVVPEEVIPDYSGLPLKIVVSTNADPGDIPTPYFLTTTGFIAIKDQDNVVTICIDSQGHVVVSGTGVKQYEVWPCVSDSDSTPSGDFTAIQTYTTDIVDIVFYGTYNLVEFFDISSPVPHLILPEMDILPSMHVGATGLLRVTQRPAPLVNALTIGPAFTTFNPNIYPSLVNFSADGCSITSFAFSDLANLQLIDVRNTPLTSLTVNNCSNATTLYLQSIANAGSFNFATSSLTAVAVVSSNLTSFDTNKYPVVVESLDLTDNKLTSVNLTRFTNLSVLRLGTNLISNQSNIVCDSSKIQTLFLDQNPISVLDLSGMPLAQGFSLNLNTLSNVIVGSHTMTENSYISLQQTDISTLNLGQITATSISIYLDQLPSLTSLSMPHCTGAYVTAHNMPLLSSISFPVGTTINQLDIDSGTTAYPIAVNINNTQCVSLAITNVTITNIDIDGTLLSSINLSNSIVTADMLDYILQTLNGSGIENGIASLQVANGIIPTDNATLTTLRNTKGWNITTN